MLLTLTFIFKLVITKWMLRHPFPNGELEEKIYIIQVKGCVVSNKENIISKL